MTRFSCYLKTSGRTEKPPCDDDHQDLPLYLCSLERDRELERSPLQDQSGLPDLHQVQEEPDHPTGRSIVPGGEATHHGQGRAHQLNNAVILNPLVKWPLPGHR